jgi:hypothetical protein
MKWEYRFKTLLMTDWEGTEENLNHLGWQGWEIVAVLPGADKDVPTAVLKRPRLVENSE